VFAKISRLVAFRDVEQGPCARLCSQILEKFARQPLMRFAREGAIEFPFHKFFCLASSSDPSVG
jgi:hypothetical protein